MVECLMHVVFDRCGDFIFNFDTNVSTACFQFKLLCAMCALLVALHCLSLPWLCEPAAISLLVMHDVHFFVFICCIALVQFCVYFTQLL